MVNFITRKMWRVEWKKKTKNKNKSVSDYFLIGSILLLHLVCVNFHATMCWRPLTAAGTAFKREKSFGLLSLF